MKMFPKLFFRNIEKNIEKEYLFDAEYVSMRNDNAKKVQLR